jgi:Family of unknown function (DUF6644)
MFMLAFDPATNPLNQNEWAFPLLEIIHIAGFTFSVGTIALVDLRLLGLGLLKKSVKQIAQDMAPWTLFGLIVMLISGPLIFTSDPNMYLHNSSFKFKMVALLVAIVYHYTVHRKVALAEVTPGDAPAIGKFVGVLSIALWVSVVAGGLFIAFV